MVEIVWSSESTPTGHPTPTGSPENIHTNSIMKTEQVVHIYLRVWIQTSWCGSCLKSQHKGGRGRGNTVFLDISPHLASCDISDLCHSLSLPTGHLPRPHFFLFQSYFDCLHSTDEAHTSTSQQCTGRVIIFIAFLMDECGSDSPSIGMSFQLLSAVEMDLLVGYFYCQSSFLNTAYYL